MFFDVFFSLDRRYYHLCQTLKPSGVHCDHFWFLPEVTTIQCKQAMQPLPGAEQALRCTGLVSQKQGNSKVQLYLLYNSL